MKMMMGGEGGAHPALLKKRVSKASSLKQLQAVPTMLKRERTRRNDVKFLETSQGYGQVGRCKYLLVANRHLRQ